MNIFYKLNEQEINRLAETGLISHSDKETLITQSLKREAGKFAKNEFKIYLNEAKSIYIQSIHFYGGEHFGKPYHFLAEISYLTTRSAFSGFMNKNSLGWVKAKMPHTY